jgi:FlaA1/EpsC-like NDP-sugar epimerase
VGGARLVGDLVTALAAFWLAFWVRTRLSLPFTSDLLPADRLSFLASEWRAVLILQVTSLYFFGFYDPRPPAPRSETLRRLLAATGAQGASLVVFYFFTDRAFPRSIVLLYVAFDAAVLFLWRTALDRRLDVPERPVVLVGCGPAAVEIATSIRERQWHGLRVAGFVPAPGEADGRPDEALGRRLGTLADVPGLLESGVAQDILLAADAGPWQTDLLESLAERRPAHTNVLLLPGPFESLVGRMRYRWVHDVPLIEVVRETEWRINWPLKRALDLVV